MKNLFYLCCIALSVASCTGRHTCSVTGKLDGVNIDGKTVYLQKYDFSNGQFSMLDSATVKDGRFKFAKIAADTLGIYGINPRDAYMGVFINEPGSIEITIDSTFMPRVKGTALNSDYQRITDSINNMFLALRSLSMNMNGKVESGELAYDDAARHWEALMKDTRDKLYVLVKANIRSLLGEYIFLNNRHMLTSGQVIDLISLARPEFSSLDRVKKIEIKAIAQEACSVGNRFIEIKGKNLDGKDIALSDYAGKGKVILLDFWASWCGPCLGQLPDLVNTYDRFKDKGFEIIAVSLDTDKDAWKKASEEYKITWPQLSGLKGFDDDAAMAYGIAAIPSTILIDEDGVIIEKNIMGEFLRSKLSELLK